LQIKFGKKMAQISIIKHSDILEGHRFDAEYFKSEYLEIEKIISESPFYKFGEITKLFVKGIFEINADVYTNEGVPFVRISNLKNMKTEESNIVYIPEIENKKNKKTELRYGDLILSKTAYPACSLVTFEKCNTSQDTIAIKLKENMNILSEYLVVFLNTRFGMAQMKRYFTGNIQMHLNLTESKQIMIPKLSSDFQKKIKEIFNLSLQNQTQSKQLYKEAENLLLEELGLVNYKPKHALTFETTKLKINDSLRFDSEYYQPKYEEIIKRIENYKNGFDVVKNVLNFNKKNFFPKPDESYYYLPLSKVSNSGEIEIPEKEFGKDLPTRARRKVKIGEIILSSIEGSLETSALINKEHEGFIVSNGFYVFNSDKINSETLLVLFKSKIMIELLRQISKGAILGGYDLTDF